MDLMLSKIITRIQSEINHEYLGTVIEWADNKYENKWTIAIDRFEKALLGFQDSFDKSPVEARKYLDDESKIYRDTCLALVAEFKQEKSMDDANAFLEGL